MICCHSNLSNSSFVIIVSLIFFLVNKGRRCL
nr:MAG TPA: hypothetical protein [Siphoviridae sp. ctEfY6]